MAVVSNPNAAVVDGNGVGPTTYVFTITTGTITTAAAITAMTTTYGLTIAGVTDADESTSYILAQGANTNGSQGAEGESGIALTVTFSQNP